MLAAGAPHDEVIVNDRRWPVGVVLVTAWLLPATTSQRTRHASFKMIWFVNIIAVLATVVAIFVLVTWYESGGRFDADTFFHQMRGVLNRLTRDLAEAPVEFVLTAAGIVLLMELAYAVLTAVVMPWGARDEPLRKSYRSAFRSTLLSATHLFAIVLLLGTLLVASQRLKQEWMIRHGLIKAEHLPTTPIPPSMSPDDPGYSKALSAYQVDVQRNQQTLLVIQRVYELSKLPKPFFIEYREPLLFGIASAMALWFLWALLRGVGASREVIPIARPPMCESCGYNLTTIAMESRCPECGEAVLKSLGPDARPGTAWQNRPMIGEDSEWGVTATMAFENPNELGHQIRTIKSGIDHRLFLALHLPIVFGVGFLTLIVFALLSAPDDLFSDELPIFLIVMTIFGLACVGGMVVFTLLAVLTIGTFESYRYKRNLLPAAMQIASYLATYLTIWAIFGGALGLGVFWAEDAYFFRGMQELTGVYHETLVVLAWLVPNVTLCLWFFLLLYRGTIGAAYANR